MQIMKKEKMRRKIALLLGWKFNPDSEDFCYGMQFKPATWESPCGNHEFEDQYLDEGCNGAWEMPNWPEDLNACHEMEMSLTDEGRKEMRVEMGEAIMRNGAVKLTGIVHATALQRCEAFLRVHNAWEEDETE